MLDYMYIRPTLEWLQRPWSLQSLDFWCCYRPDQNFLGKFRSWGKFPQKGAWINPRCCKLSAFLIVNRRGCLCVDGNA